MRKLLLLLAFVLLPIITFSQEVQNAINHVGPSTGSSNTEGVKGDNTLPQNLSERYFQFETKMRALKLSGNNVGSNYIELQKQIDAETKQGVTEQGKFYNGNLYQSSEIQEVDAIGNSAVLIKNGMKGIATATEQRGANAGKIWAVAGFQGAGSSASPDSLRIFYSTNGGITWVLYALATLGGTDKINQGEIDCEIIESTTGDKFLHVVYGLRGTGGTGKYFVGGLSLNITTFAGVAYAFSWPGNNAALRYYMPRITSDNASYPGNSWLYIAISFDSGGINTQKLVRCTSPYTTSPVWSYKADKIWWQQGGSTAPQRMLYTDIAYFKNGTSDSLIVSYSGVPDSTKIFFSKMAISGISPSVSGQYISSVGGSEPNNYKHSAKLSSNGIDNGSIICIFNQSGTTEGVKYFRTTNYGNFNTIFQSVIWTASGGVSPPDIMGVREANTHRIGFFFWGATDSLKYISVNSSGGFTTNSAKMNGIALTTGAYSPAVGLRFVSNDSCFALYSASGPVNMWAATGCSGTITNIVNTEAPIEFRLSQNYPNPFNPVTKISYALPKSGLVNLKVFDILGKEIATLVNEVKNAGNYTVDFSGTGLTSGVYFYKLESNGLSDIKRMMLIK
ncbi:MAG: T9SS type A sorting domain-containing protein [Ignavibacteria bacterium]